MDARAAAFIEWYAEQFPTLRHGARYRRRDPLEFPDAVALVGDYPDDWLRTLAALWMVTDHHFAQQGNRSIKHFASMAQWCDTQLREAGYGPHLALPTVDDCRRVGRLPPTRAAPTAHRNQTAAEEAIKRRCQGRPA